MRAKLCLILASLLLLATAGCEPLVQMSGPGTPAPTVTVFREVVDLAATRTPEASPTPDGVVGISTPMASPTPYPARAQVHGTSGNGLNGRLGPSLNQGIKTVYAEGSQVQILEGPVEADGFIWWRVESGGEAAWVASKWLRFEVAPTPAP